MSMDKVEAEILLCQVDEELTNLEKNGREHLEMVSEDFESIRYWRGVLLACSRIRRIMK